MRRRTLIGGLIGGLFAGAGARATHARNPDLEAGEFWRLWNPIFGYVLIFFVYRPLRRRMPRPVAVYRTFLTSGLLARPAL